MQGDYGSDAEDTGAADSSLQRGLHVGRIFRASKRSGAPELIECALTYFVKPRLEEAELLQIGQAIKLAAQSKIGVGSGCQK